jgi:pimeloyl-ACP methyl ester carboxylesterase
MSIFEISSEESLYYEYQAPASTDNATFVFFNALTGDTEMWKNTVTDSLVNAGHGYLVYNMRGQANSPFKPDTTLDQSVIVTDASALLADVNPPNPVFVGLSIGGIFAAWTALQGAKCAGMVFINTLRRDGPRLQWINDAVVRMSEVGGPDLLRDIMSPLIMNEEWQAENRKDSLTGDDYTPIDQNSGAYNLLSSARTTNWDFPYEELKMPTLVLTGTHDRVFRDPADVETLYARLPNARRIDVADAGHMIPVERPDTLSSALLDMAAWIGGKAT